MKTKQKNKKLLASKMSVMLPCPFCGGKADLLPMAHTYNADEQVGYKIRCIICDASVYEVTNYKIQAIVKWNKRVAQKRHGA